MLSNPVQGCCVLRPNSSDRLWVARRLPKLRVRRRPLAAEIGRARVGLCLVLAGLLFPDAHQLPEQSERDGHVQIARPEPNGKVAIRPGRRSMALHFDALFRRPYRV